MEGVALTTVTYNVCGLSTAEGSDELLCSLDEEARWDVVMVQELSKFFLTRRVKKFLSSLLLMVTKFSPPKLASGALQ